MQLAIEEKLSVTLLRDGGLQAMEIKGDLQLLVTDPNYAKVCLGPRTIAKHHGRAAAMPCRIIPKDR